MSFDHTSRYLNDEGTSLVAFSDSDCLHDIVLSFQYIGLRLSCLQAKLFEITHIVLIQQ